MADFIDWLAAGLIVAFIGSSLLFGAMILLFTDKSKLSAVERNTAAFYWNKEILFKSARADKRHLIWWLATAQKYSLYGVLTYVVLGTIFKLASSA